VLAAARTVAADVLLTGDTALRAAYEA